MNRKAIINGQEYTLLELLPSLDGGQPLILCEDCNLSLIHICILVSVLACCGFAALCALSHPAVALLPQRVYFPCLGAAFVALCCVVWFSVRQHRGA